MRVKDLLKMNEDKQVGTLYHFTTLNRLHDIMKQDVPFRMYSLNGEIFSTTRNAILPMLNNDLKNSTVRITIDGDKISEKYKVKPLLGLIDNEKDVFDHKHNSYRVKRSSGENEEAIKKIPVDLLPYIKHIHIIRNRNDDKFVQDQIVPYLEKFKIKYTYSKSFSVGAMKEEDHLSSEMKFNIN